MGFFDDVWRETRRVGGQIGDVATDVQHGLEDVLGGVDRAIMVGDPATSDQRVADYGAGRGGGQFRPDAEVGPADVDQYVEAYDLPPYSLVEGGGFQPQALTQEQLDLGIASGALGPDSPVGEIDYYGAVDEGGPGGAQLFTPPDPIDPANVTGLPTAAGTTPPAVGTTPATEGELPFLEEYISEQTPTSIPYEGDFMGFADQQIASLNAILQDPANAQYLSGQLPDFFGKTGDANKRKQEKWLLEQNRVDTAKGDLANLLALRDSYGLVDKSYEQAGGMYDAQAKESLRRSNASFNRERIRQQNSLGRMGMGGTLGSSMNWGYLSNQDYAGSRIMEDQAARQGQLELAHAADLTALLTGQNIGGGLDSMQAYNMMQNYGQSGAGQGGSNTGSTIGGIGGALLGFGLGGPGGAMAGYQVGSGIGSRYDESRR